MKLRQIILIAVVLAVAGVTLSCVWLAQAEYRFSNRPEVSFDLRVRWLSLVVALFFVIAGLGGVVGLWQFVMNKWVHHRQFTQWEDLETKLLAGVCALGAAALICCGLAIYLDLDEGARQGQLEAVEPGQVVGRVQTTRGVRFIRSGARATTGFEAYWFQALTCAVSIGFTCYVASLLGEKPPIITRPY